MSRALESNKIFCGDALATLQTFPNACVQCCVTSPPYFGMRDYGGGPLQIGLEETPEEYIDHLALVMHEVRRVLKHNGILWLNLGDSFTGGNRGGQPSMCSQNWRPAYPPPYTDPSLGRKQLLGIPWRVALRLQADGWILRCDAIWDKGNALPESVKDRPTRSHEYIFLLAKSEHYFYNADAIREPHTTKGNKRRKSDEPWGASAHLTPVGEGLREWNHPLGRNKRSVWNINTQPLPQAHFAAMPPKLVEPCILAGSRPGDVVLDPFMGSGTVALVAKTYGRQYIGIELNPEYVALAEKRIAVVQPVLWGREQA